MTAVVNAANAQLLPGGGVAGEIRQPAGPQLDRETLPGCNQDEEVLRRLAN
jgi:O-acetyl-ADP-ribose deacetylase (regulator of RNase III)